MLASICRFQTLPSAYISCQLETSFSAMGHVSFLNMGALKDPGTHRNMSRHNLTCGTLNLTRGMLNTSHFAPQVVYPKLAISFKDVWTSWVLQIRTCCGCGPSLPGSPATLWNPSKDPCNPYNIQWNLRLSFHGLGLS